MRGFRIIVLVSGFWALHCIVYLSLVGVALAEAGQGRAVPTGWIHGTLAVLGQPLMPLVPRIVQALGPGDLGAGNGVHWLIGAALLNALLWAAAIVALLGWLVRRIRRKVTGAKP